MKKVLLSKARYLVPNSKVIAIEGMDGVGKETISKIVTEKLKAITAPLDVEIEHVSFPRYNEPEGKLIQKLLVGEYGISPLDMDPYTAGTLYTLDRMNYFRNHPIDACGKILVMDRSYFSNVTYQGVKFFDFDKSVDIQGGREYIKWAVEQFNLEFIKTRLCNYESQFYFDPIYLEPPVVFFLRMSPEDSKKQMESRANLDLNEMNQAYQDKVNNHHKIFEHLEYLENNNLGAKIEDLLVRYAISDKCLEWQVEYFKNAYLRSPIYIDVPHGDTPDEIEEITHNIADQIVNRLDIHIRWSTPEIANMIPEESGE